MEICNLTQGESIFTKQNSFDNEKEFISDLLRKLPDIFYNAYNEKIKEYFLEYSILLAEYGEYNLRADIFVKCESGINYIIECKNPTHDKAENFNAIGQMIAYDMLINDYFKNTKIILATSIFKFYIAKALKRYKLNFDIILNNKISTAILLNKDL
jgi:hypothetical protein